MARKRKIVETETPVETNDVIISEVKPETEKAKEPDVVSEAKERNQRKTDIPNTYEIPVKSNVAGGLTYVSRKNKGLEFYWEHTGDVEYIEYSELISMRNTQRKFFENNWIVIIQQMKFTEHYQFRSFMNLDLKVSMMFLTYQIMNYRKLQQRLQRGLEIISFSEQEHFMLKDLISSTVQSV